MRVITTFFSMECPRLVPGSSLEATPTQAATSPGSDASSISREWLGLHEGEQRAARLVRPVPPRRPKGDTVDVQVVCFTLLME